MEEKTPQAFTLADNDRSLFTRIDDNDHRLKKLHLSVSQGEYVLHVGSHNIGEIRSSSVSEFFQKSLSIKEILNQRFSSLNRQIVVIAIEKFNSIDISVDSDDCDVDEKSPYSLKKSFSLKTNTEIFHRKRVETDMLSFWEAMKEFGYTQEDIRLDSLIYHYSRMFATHVFMKEFKGRKHAFRYFNPSNTLELPQEDGFHFLVVWHK